MLPLLKFSEIKKDPAVLLGWDRPVIITRYGDVVAYLVSPQKMEELLEAEKKLNSLTKVNYLEEQS